MTLERASYGIVQLTLQFSFACALLSSYMAWQCPRNRDGKCATEISGHFSPLLMLAVDPRVEDVRLALVAQLGPITFGAMMFVQCAIVLEGFAQPSRE